MSINTLSSQDLGSQLLNGADKLKIRFNYNQKFILVDVQFDILPLTFILDTGAEHVILFKKEYSDLLGFEYDKRIMLMGADLDQEVYALISRDVSMKLKGSKVVDRDVIILEEDFLHLDKLTGESIDGIIGGRFLRGSVVEIDYKKKKLVFHDKRSFENPGDKFFEYDIEIENHKPYLQSNLTLDDGEEIDAKILIDTGAALPLLLFLQTHPSLILPENVVQGNLGRGLGGNLVGFLSLLRKLELTDDFKFENLLTSYQDFIAYENPEIYVGRNGLIGNPLLERFHVYIDYVSQKLYLKPYKKKKYNKSFEYDKSGLVLYAFGPKLDNFYVKKVIPDSPGAEADIQEGDKLVRIGWQSTKSYTLERIYKKFQKKAGTKIKLTLEREGQFIQRNIILKDFFKNY